MIELPPMDKCPAHKRGRHELMAVIPSEDDKDLTVVCSHCGALRRMPASGPVLSPEAPAMEYLVGERGPEFVIPARPGNVIPHG